MKRYFRSRRTILELLQDQFLLPVVAELVGAEEVAVVEGCQVVNVDLSRLEEDGKEETR